MPWPKQILDALRKPESIRYLAIAVVGVVVLGVLALSGGDPERKRVTTGEQATAPEEVAPGEPLPGESVSPDATAIAGSKTKAGAKAATGTKVGADIAISETQIAVGIAYVTNPGTFNSAAGFTGIGQVNQKRAWELMIKEVNKNAPFGRKVVPVFFSTSEENAVSKGETLWEEACAHWTKDNKVFMTWVAGTDTLKACLTKNRVAQIGQGTGFSYAKTFKDYPWYIEHNASALDRMAQFEVDQLHERGYFSKCKTTSKTELACVDGQPRIALIRYDLPSYKAAAATMKQTLASHGLSLCSGCEFEMTLGATADVSAQLDDATEIQNAIASCKSPHTAPGASPGPCTHLLFLGSNAGCRQQAFYMQPAEQQQFRPRLGLNSLDCGGAFWDDRGQPEYRDNQYKESILVGHTPGSFQLRPAAFAECKKLFTDGGETFGGSEDTANNKEGQINGYCDVAWYHIAAFNKVGQTVTLDTFLDGVANTGLVKSAGTFLMRTTATRHDGASAVRIGEWNSSTRTHKPVTGDIPV